MALEVRVDTRRRLGAIDGKLFGHFIEHFHRQIYGGVFEPGSPLSDSLGLRNDVAEAMQGLGAPVVRWPGGCFVSAYHWKDGVGPAREPSFDKAWRVEEPNTFGTDEFIAWCRKIGTEPYVCTNAGTGTPEEMSDWVEYCNLHSEGRWAKLRQSHGHAEPYKVKYWSIGNENYLGGEMGSKTPQEWCRFVKESAKMMKRVDPTIELFAASTPDLEWNRLLLQEAGEVLDWISIHGYWDPLWINNNLAPYETCMAYTTRIETPIEQIRAILTATGQLGKIRVAFDEWNLRGWHHPYVDTAANAADCIRPRDENDRNSSYTMADAVFSACFLNACVRHSDLIGMANFAPSVNARGLIYAHPEGIVKRSTYFVFQALAEALKGTSVGVSVHGDAGFSVGDSIVPCLDAAAALETDGSWAVSLVNRHPEQAQVVDLRLDAGATGKATWCRVNGPSKDSYNDIGRSEVGLERGAFEIPSGDFLSFSLPPHSVTVVRGSL